MNPDASVTALESEMLGNRPLSNADVLTESISDVSHFDELPMRPAYGTHGARISVWTNYFPLDLNADGQVYVQTLKACRHPEDLEKFGNADQTEADNSQESLSKDQNQIPPKKLRQIVRLFLAQTIELGDSADHLASDLAQYLITSRPVGFVCSRTFDVAYHSELDSSMSIQAYQVTVQAPNVVSYSDTMKFLTSADPNARFSDRGSIIQALNILMGDHQSNTAGYQVFHQNKVFNMADRATRNFT